MDTPFITFASDVLAETKEGLSGSKIAEYCTAYAEKFNVKIPYASYPFPESLPNKRTALRENILAFKEEQRFIILKELCQLPELKEIEAVKGLKIRLFSRYGKKYSEVILSDLELVQETKHWLGDYSAALSNYESALLKFDNNLFERNVLDDMRLSFELLLKELLSNNKSLENQIAGLGQILKSFQVSPELRNMYTTLLNYYKDYQNTYVKHNDNVNIEEMEFIIELTSLMMRFIVKLNK